MADIAAEFLNESDYNVIVVDYSPIAELDYISAVADSKSIGTYLQFAKTSHFSARF